MDPSIGRRVALKELQLPANLVGSARRERIERFYREAKAAGALTHPNIVTIYEVGDEAGRHFIAMEFLEGQTLQDQIEIRGTLPPKEAVDTCVQVLEALDYAHSKGIIHRDIKPANIQMLPGGLVKLTDFGIARIMHEPSITQSGQIFGTPSYMSPEQVMGKEIDPRSDLFSLGVVLYEALTGGKPFTGDSVVTITYNITNNSPARPANIPDALADIVVKAMEKDPSGRFQSAREFADALKSDWAAQSSNVLVGSAPPVPPPIFFPPGQQQNPTASGQTAAPPFGQLQTSQSTSTPQSSPAPNLPPPGQTAYSTSKSRGPLLTQRQRAAMATIVTALALGAAFLAAIYFTNQAYEQYQLRANDKKAAENIRKGNELVKRNQLMAAVEQYKAALRMELTTKTKKSLVLAVSSCYDGIAQDFLNNGNPSAAIENLKLALKYVSDSGNTLFLMGAAYTRLNQWPQAITYFEQAISLDPESDGGRQARGVLAQYYWNRASDFYQQGDMNSAVDYWQKVLQTDPGSHLAQAAQDQIDKALLR